MRHKTKSFCLYALSDMPHKLLLHNSDKSLLAFFSLCYLVASFPDKQSLQGNPVPLRQKNKAPLLQTSQIPFVIVLVKSHFYRRHTITIVCLFSSELFLIRLINVFVHCCVSLQFRCQKSNNSIIAKLVDSTISLSMFRLIAVRR